MAIIEQQKTSLSPMAVPGDEHILVVKREKLFLRNSWQGFRPGPFDDIISRVEHNKEFKPRSLMELDPDYKQIIPYLVFMQNDLYFLMQRQDSSSEQRLKSKYSLGIGGHIREEDMGSSDMISWARREFHEEILYNGNFTVSPIGVINDDRNPVGQVHLGCVFLLTGDSPRISIKSELKSGRLLSLRSCSSFYDLMEPWSQMVYDVLAAP
jgi:predicted NUDIX family phosphoesterase